ncbi:MAG: complex I NDUFA9 subunit family protein [Alphaproteobacteria bacterium]
MTLDQKTITVFGGTGFLGRHIIWQLAKTGANIRVATRSKERAYFLRPAGSVGQITPVLCSIHSDQSVASVLDGATHAIYLPGLLYERGKFGTFKKVHVEAAERVARAAKAARLQVLVHFSALGAALDAPSEYLRTKAEGESKAIHAFSRTAILRPGVVFGPEDDFFNKFAGMERLYPLMPLIAGGKTQLQPVYVGDIAKAVYNIIADPECDRHGGHIYELGGPATYTLRQLMELTGKHTGKNKCYLPLPLPVAKIAGAMSSLCSAILSSKPALTVDQVKTLTRNSILQPGSPGLKELGVTATDVEAILPTYLARFKQGGRFGSVPNA